MARPRTAAGAQDSAPSKAVYKSALFSRFCEGVARHEAGVPILDLGPSATRNVMFWIRRGHSVSAHDLGARGFEPGQRLDNPDDSFGGVLAWTSLSHLEADAARDLIHEIGRVLCPGGWFFGVFDGDGRKPPLAHRYHIVSADELSYDADPRRAPPRAVPTREVENLLHPFREVRVMVMRHGSREALGRQP